MADDNIASHTMFSHYNLVNAFAGKCCSMNPIIGYKYPIKIIKNIEF